MSNTPVVDALKQVLADTYALYMKTQNYHWNVEGPHFKALHELFEEQYRDLFGAIDEAAEHIRQLGHKAPGTLSSYVEKTTIKPGSENADWKTMVRELAEDQVAIEKTLHDAAEVADNADDEVVEDFLVQRQIVHRKAGWMLKSHLAA